MAKKKKTKVTKKVTKKPSAQKTKTKKPATAKAATRKVSKPKEPTSVDGILKKFSKKRTTLDSLAVSTRKKIEDLEKKVNDSLAQIDKLIDKETETKKAISELDSRRDAEVSSLLAKLGIRFTKAIEAPKATPPSAPKPPPSKSDWRNNGSSDSNKPKVTFATTGPHSDKDDSKEK